MDYLGHHFEQDEKATQVAQKDADAFMVRARRQDRGPRRLLSLLL